MGRQLNALLLGVPVFVKVMGIALGMVLFLGTGMLWQIHRTWHAHLVRGLERQAQQIANQLGAYCSELSRAGLADDIPAELQHTLAESPDLVYVVLRDTNGVVLAEAHLNGRTSNAARVRELSAETGVGPHQLRVGLSLERANNEVAWLTRKLARVTAVIALLGVVAAWWLTRILTHPIRELVTLTRAVKAGDYQVNTPIRAADEVGELATAFNEMTDAVGRKEQARQQLLRQVIRAGEEERKRIARELHDHTGQALTSQIAALSALENESRDEATRRRLTELRRQTERSLTEVHDLSVALRPSVLDDVGLMAALQRHCRHFAQRTGVQVKCEEIGLNDRRLPAEVELTIYRVVQEALTNAVRHGRAGRVQTLVQRVDAGVQTIIQDNGRGFDANDWQRRCIEENRLGLLGIEERVTLLGGEFCVESEPGKGVIVYANIPLKEQT